MEQQYRAKEGDIGMRADVFLSEQAGLTRSKAKQLMKAGNACFRDGASIKPSYPMAEGDIIVVTLPEPEESHFIAEDIPLDIIYEDSHLIVVNKEPGIVVHPGRGNVRGTLAAGLLHHCKSLSTLGGEQRPGIVHRLDKDTSGLLLVALNDETHYRLSTMLQARDIKRIYTAYAWGHTAEESGTIDAPIGRNRKRPTLKTVVPGGRHAVTHYRTEVSYDFLSRVRVELETGRTHQIRVHFSHIGHHIFGDPDYGGRDERLKGFSVDVRSHARRLLKLIDRQALHAGRIEFTHPVTGEFMCFEADPPADMQNLGRELQALSR